VVGEGSPCIVLRCSPYHTHSTLYPVIEHLQRWLSWRRDETPEVKLDTLDRVLQASGLAPNEIAPLLAALLSVPLPNGRYPPLLLSPPQQRQQTLDALVAWLLAETERQPVLAVWEDLHWADPSTLELLGLLIEQAPMARMLTLLTARPEFRPPWAPRSHLTQLTLGRLPGPQVETMVRQLTADKPLPAEVLEQVIARTDGVPLFVEELVKMILESGLVREETDRYMLTRALPPLAIPATLQDSLMARLDRLSTARAVAQLGAVLGREFAYELIGAVAPLDEATVQQGLAQLVEAELLYQRGHPPQATYLFKHALIQETAYHSLLKSTRQQYHQRIAQVLAVRFPEVVETQPELLAYHYTEARLNAQAIPYWQRAGQQALQRSAHPEAIDHLSRGLALVKTLPDTPERGRQEFLLHIALGAPLIAMKGHGAPEVEHAYNRALELCRQMGESPQLVSALLGLWRFYTVRGELRTAHELAEQLVTRAQNLRDLGLLLEAHLSLGITLFYRGELPIARIHLEQAMTLYDPQQHHAYAFIYGQDPGMAALSYVARVVWLLGYPELALQWSQKALTLARELSHPFSLVFALHFAAKLHQLRRETQPLQARVEAVMALSHEQGFQFFWAVGTILQGWALVEHGQLEEGIAQMRQGLTAHRSTGAELDRPHHLVRLAEAYGKAGQVTEGLAVLDEALAVTHKHGECYYEAELYRLKGELLLAREDTRDQAKGQGQELEEVETYFRHALTAAHRQQAKSLELRAAMSLARLWQQQGKPTEALDLLAEIYGWFTEGFDTADLQEAKAVLEELAS
jgi:predicted ATPase